MDTGILSILATFAMGFVVRPFGAVLFGHLGDLIGRKYTFMVTLLLMGGATLLIGVLPGFATIGWAAPVLLIVLRLCQGLALGGEYGGAATYVAEHCRDGKRGYWTSWFQTTATLGLSVSLGVTLSCRGSLTTEQCMAWAWRIPFSSLAGLAPFNHDSGRMRGVRAIRGGGAAARTVLYMAAVNAMRFNPVIRAFAQRLSTAGKRSKVVITACMRKILVVLNAMVRDRLTWDQLKLATAC